ncbi:hypothetical protein CYMTET_28644 [Cymbomonas tetramitiformis]|uniref:Uncharacterized protein n=1 Tax=Cymbomonas tetramitiformis TaxID=36881 RepID=A0AAE0FP17_9CHLO|nr:hypothetical protein CYMTET_28644 [Cymbomonas tetramitiformis]
MTARSSAVRRLLRDSDIGPGINLSEVVRNTHTLITPEAEDPGAAKADDTANVIARRKTFSDQTDIVKRVRESGLHRKWAKNLRETVLGGKHERFAGKDKDVASSGSSSYSSRLSSRQLGWTWHPSSSATPPSRSFLW